MFTIPWQIPALFWSSAWGPLQSSDEPNLEPALAEYRPRLLTVLRGRMPTALAAMLVFVAAFARGPVSWILCSESFPTKVRGRAMSVVTFYNWTSCYPVAQTVPMTTAKKRQLPPVNAPGDRLAERLVVGPSATFWIHAVFSLAGFLFVLASVPEAKGLTLEEIEQMWSTGNTVPRA